MKLLTMIESLLIEGGNAFDGVNSVVPSKHLSSTIENALSMSGLGGIRYSVIGNYKKPLLGDIDIAVSAVDVGKSINSPNDADFWSNLASFFSENSKQEFKINKGLQQAHLLAPLVDKKGKHLDMVSSVGEVGNESGYVQIDIMIGDLEFMEKSLSTSGDGSKYKAVYRNLLLADIFSQVIFKTSDPEIRRKFQMNWKKGVEVVDFKTQGNKKKKVRVKMAFNSMDGLAGFLFGEEHTFDDIDSFEKLYGLMMSSSFMYRKFNDKIFDAYKKTLPRFGLDVPAELANKETPQ